MNFESNHSDLPNPIDDVAEASLAQPKATPARLSLSGWVAWWTIGLVTIGMFSLNAFAQKMISDEASSETSIVDLMPIQMQGKMLVGQKNLFTAPATVEKTDVALGADADAKSANENHIDELASVALPPELDVGPYEQRLCYTILVNELQGADAAIDHLKITDKRAATANLELNETQTALRQSIGSLLDKYQAGETENGVEDKDKDLLKDRLGWIGRLALVPAGTSDITERRQVLGEATTGMFVFSGAVVGGLLMLGLGLVSAIVMLVLVVNKKVKAKFLDQSAGLNIYIETFAIWMVIFFGGQILIPMLMSFAGFKSELMQIGAMPPLFFGSLIALAWPMFRGIPFSQVRQDIGWKIGNPFIEIGAGAFSYLSLLPGLFAALVFISICMFFLNPPAAPEIFSKGSGPGHPIQEYIAQGSWLMIGLVIFTACVAAPIIEETMFRGVLYRHLRDMTAGKTAEGKWISVGISCLLNSFIFASIHPQGVLGIPMLMVLAIGFSLVREWRSSLFAPMLMHGINNLIVTMLLLAML